MNKLSKKLLLLILITIITMIFVTNKTHAQIPNQDYPFIMRKFAFYSLTRLPDNINTYEFEVVYRYGGNYADFLRDIGNDYYFITSHNIPLQKGTNRETNAYKAIRLSQEPYTLAWTYITLQVTLEKSFVDENYSFNSEDDNYINKFFSEHSVFYVKYIHNPNSTNYSNGYNSGYNDGEQIGYDYGYPIGYDKGYKDGYERGLAENYQNGYNYGYELGRDDGYDKGAEDTAKKYYNEGYNKGFSDWFNDKFSNNFYIWIIPAIILVFGIGIFVSYRKARE